MLWYEMAQCSLCVMRSVSMLQVLRDCNCQLNETSRNSATWVAIKKEMVSTYMCIVKRPCSTYVNVFCDFA